MESPRYFALHKEYDPIVGATYLLYLPCNEDQKDYIIVKVDSSGDTITKSYYYNEGRYESSWQSKAHLTYASSPPFAVSFQKP